MIDLEVAKEQGIVVSNQPGRTAPVVAEHMVGLYVRSGQAGPLSVCRTWQVVDASHERHATGQGPSAWSERERSVPKSLVWDVLWEWR